MKLSLSPLTKLSTSIFTFSVLTYTGATTALANQAQPLQPKGDINNGSSLTLQSFFQNIFDSVINFILFLAGAVAVIYLIWAGVKYITAGGDSGKAEDARKAIINAIIGIIIIVAAYFIINFAIGIGGTLEGVSEGEVIFN